MFISPSSRIWLLVHISVQATSCIPTLSSEIRRRNSFIFRARLRTRTLSPRHLTVLSGAWPVRESRFLHLSTHRHFRLVDYRAWTTASVVCTKAFKMVVKFAAGLHCVWGWPSLAHTSDGFKTECTDRSIRSWTWISRNIIVKQECIDDANLTG